MVDTSEVAAAADAMRASNLCREIDEMVSQ